MLYYGGREREEPRKVWKGGSAQQRGNVMELEKIGKMQVGVQMVL